MEEIIECSSAYNHSNLTLIGKIIKKNHILGPHEFLLENRTKHLTRLKQSLKQKCQVLFQRFTGDEKCETNANTKPEIHSQKFLILSLCRL